MTRLLRYCLPIAVLSLWGCGKKTETPPTTAPTTPTATASNSAATPPAQPMTESAEPADEPAAPVTPVEGESPYIAKARAYLGTEQALNAINTIRYVGTLVTSANDPKDPNKQTRASIEIVLQKPDHQRVNIKSEKTFESTALNGYEGWTRITAANDPSKWQQTLLGVEGIKRLRANTWENLAFFRGIEEDGGRVEDQGPATKDGIACEKVAFIHSPNTIFYRYFDQKTGRVVYTETENGGTIKEHGEVIVNGVRFPKSITTVSKGPSGQEQTVTITFDKITVNEPLPPDYFSVPPLKNP